MALYSRFLATYHSMSGLPSGPQGGPLDPNIRPRNQVAANDPMFLHCSRDWKQQFAARYRLFDSASYGSPTSDASLFAAVAPPNPLLQVQRQRTGFAEACSARRLRKSSRADKKSIAIWSLCA